MKSTNKKKVNYGQVDISEEDLKRAKIRVTAFIDFAIVKALKQEAAEKGAKYQTLMNQKLHDAVFGKQIDDHLRHEIREIIREELEKKSA